MLYYTVSYFFYGDRYTQKPGLLNIKPEQISDKAWDCIFTNIPISDGLFREIGISKESF